MATSPANLWTIDELGAQVVVALAADQPDMPSGRVREVPDMRTIRYYTTLGLIDRPAHMRGRTALYGHRHLLQLVAIKRLQGRGLTLAEIQQRLLGQSDASLRKIAQLPAQAQRPVDPAPVERRQFWSDVPEARHDRETVTELAEGANLCWQGVRLEEGAMLLFEAGRSLDEEDVAALRTAAAPLLKLLHTRRLSRPRTERGTP